MRWLPARARGALVSGERGNARRSVKEAAAAPAHAGAMQAPLFRVHTPDAQHRERNHGQSHRQRHAGHFQAPRGHHLSIPSQNTFATNSSTKILVGTSYCLSVMRTLKKDHRIRFFKSTKSSSDGS